VQDEHGMPALEYLRPWHPAALLVVAAVPHDHAAVVGRALERVVRDLVVLDLDGQAPWTVPATTARIVRDVRGSALNGMGTSKGSGQS
jgi:hypothetical protein